MSNTKKMKIGYYGTGYNEMRIIIDKIGGVEYVRLSKFDDPVRCFWVLVLRICNKLKTDGKVRQIAEARTNSFIHSYRKYDVDVVHTWSIMAFSNCPYVVSVESIVPRCPELLNYFKGWEEIQRYTRFVKKIATRLADEECLRLLSISKNSRKLTEAVITGAGLPDDVTQCILNKLMVLHPPQKILVTEKDIRERYSIIRDRLRFIFVGRDFFRKGGMEILNTLKKYEDRCELLLISSMESLGYARLNWTIEDKEAAVTYINENKSWITWMTETENKEILELCKTSHVGLMPTYDDTYGYSVLEMQAAGVPVVTTNVRALPEINNNECGWMIEFDINEYGEASYATAEQKKLLSIRLSSELERVFADIFANPERLQDKALASLDRIKKYHSPENYAAILQKIYTRAI